MLTHLYVFPWFFVDILLPPSLNRRTRWVQPAPTVTFRGTAGDLPQALNLKLEHANVHNREISGALVHTQVLHLRGVYGRCTCFLVRAVLILHPRRGSRREIVINLFFL